MGTYLKGEAANPKRLYFILIECVMKFLTIGDLLIYTVGGTAAVVFKVDPFGRYIERLLSNSLSPTALFCIRTFEILLIGSELYRVFMTYLPIAIILLVTLNSTLENLIKYINESSVQRSKIRISRLIFFMKAVDTFRVMKVYFRKNECVYATFIPIIIFSGSALIVVTNYCTIKLYGIVLPPIYFIFPVISLTVLTVVPEAANIHESSLKLQRNIARLSQTKYEKCVVRSLRVFGMHATFFMFRKEIKREIVGYQLDYTVNLLLSL